MRNKLSTEKYSLKRISRLGMKIFFLLAVITFINENCLAQELSYKGQISSWGMANRNLNEWTGKAGLRFIPQFNYTYSEGDSIFLSTEILFNIHYETDFNSRENKFDTYRALLRYSTEQSELQMGLQKINFGSAQLLRPLMWFDRLDPRDPLKLTDGVYAVRYRYSFLDNSLLWLWCLWGNKENIGYETYPTLESIPEFGGRFQTPVLSGEMAATFHTRRVNASLYYYRENRYALDGRWDIGIGIWFESVLQQNFSNLISYKFNRMTTIGADYTIQEWGGIYIMAEHLVTAFSNSFWNTDFSRQISAVMISHSPGTLDNISLQEYYDWDNKNLYQYFQYQRTYDNFIINLALFHYPENGGNLFLNGKTSSLSGYGFQLMLIFNY